MNPSRRLFGAALLAAPTAILAQSSPTVAAYIAANGGPATVFAALQQSAQPGPGNPYAAGWLLLVRRAGVPSCLLSACTDLGLRTTGDVLAFVQRCSLSYAEVDGLFPAIMLDTAVLTPYSTILTAATQQFTLSRAGDAGSGASDAFKNDTANGSFVRLPRAKILEAAAKFPRRDADYWRVNLCEAKARSLRAWFDDQGYGNAAVGTAGLFMYQYGQFLRGHEVAVIAEDNPACTLWVVDGAANPAGFVKFPGNEAATSCKLARFYW